MHTKKVKNAPIKQQNVTIVAKQATLAQFVLRENQSQAPKGSTITDQPTKNTLQSSHLLDQLMDQDLLPNNPFHTKTQHMNSFTTQYQTVALQEPYLEKTYWTYMELLMNPITMMRNCSMLPMLQ